MRVLIYAIDFAPKIGGEETYLLLLGQGLAHRLNRAQRADAEGEQWRLIVATRTGAEGSNDETLSFPVIRQPDLVTLWRLLGEADIVQLSGPVLVPLLLAYLRGKPIVITHHMYHSSCPNGLLLYKSSNDVCAGHFAARRYHECLRCNAVSAGWWKSLFMDLRPCFATGYASGLRPISA